MKVLCFEDHATCRDEDDGIWCHASADGNGYHSWAKWQLLDYEITFTEKYLQQSDGIRADKADYQSQQRCCETCGYTQIARVWFPE